MILQAHHIWVFSFFIFFYSFCFWGLQVWYMEIPRQGLICSCSCQPMPQPQQCGIWAMSVTYTTAHGSTASLVHWTRPGTEHTSSWILVRFVNCWATIGTHFFIGLFVFCCWVVWVVCVFWRLSACWLHPLQIFSPILWVAFFFF